MEFEVPGMDEVKKGEGHMSLAAAFVEGGIQEACDDACSICLEAFCDSNPSSVTSCKHEFHLQCILEWCQRSSNCPMCWQPISLKDPSSQDLLDSVQQERSFRFAPSRNAAIFHHPAFGDFELQHLPVGVSDPELEERIIQHLAAAAAMGRTHRIARMEGSRSSSSAHAHAHARPQFVVFSAHPNASSSGPVPASLAAVEVENEPNATIEINPSVPPTSIHNEGTLYISSSSQNNQVSASSVASACRGISNDNRSFVHQSSPPNQDRAGPSEWQSFSDSWRSRLNAMSMKYKESISKSSRGWKEKLLSRSSSMADIGSEVRREVNARIATVSRMMERLEPRDNNGNVRVPLANNVVESSDTELSHRENRDTPNEPLSNGINSASFASGSSLS